MGVAYNTSVVLDGLVMYLDAANPRSYPGNGTNWYDLSSSKMTGVLTGSPTYNSNGYFTFNGAGAYVECGTNTITGSSAFTLSSWFNTATVSKYSGAITIGTSGTGTSAYIGTVNATQVGTSQSIGGGFYSNNWGTGVTTLNTWLQIVFTYAGGASGLSTFYVNGIVKLNQNYSGTPNIASTYTRIGRIGIDTLYDVNGSIGIAQIYNRALTAAEVSQNFQALRGRYGI